VRRRADSAILVVVDPIQADNGLRSVAAPNPVHDSILRMVKALPAGGPDGTSPADTVDAEDFSSWRNVGGLTELATRLPGDAAGKDTDLCLPAGMLFDNQLDDCSAAKPATRSRGDVGG
jgi:hypothetical protein